MSWAAIRGHDLIVRAFARASRKRRIGHAYLFVGPRGVGKHRFARELAKTLLCESPQPHFEACDRCASCHLVNADTHPDLFQVRRPEESVEFPIEAIRELSVNLALKPARGGRKIAILDDADDLNDASANSFLKTLEEPPPQSVLILIGGASYDHQLPTIVSRCQIIRFGPLTSAVLREILQSHDITDPARQDRLLRLCAGSAGQALALEDEGLWQFRQRLLEGLSADRIDSVTLAKDWMRFLEESGKDSATHRRTASLVVKLLVGILETALRLSLGAEVSGLDPAEMRRTMTIAEKFEPEQLMEWIERAGRADYHIDRRVQLILAVEGLMDEMGRARTVGPAPSH